MTKLPQAVIDWKERGEYCSISGLNIFFINAVYTGNSTDSNLLVIHGFPGSSFEWHRILSYFVDYRQVVIPDLPGYGLSDKPPYYSYSLMEQADIIEMLMKKLDIESVELIAHNMGTSVACELLARQSRNILSFDISRCVLMNGSVHIEMAHLTPSQYLLRSPLANLFVRVASKKIFIWQLSRLTGKHLKQEDYDAMWSLLRFRDGHLRLPKINRYIKERHLYWHRWIGTLKQLDIPAGIVWGTEDPVAVPHIAEQLDREIPQSNLVWLEGLGHFPQLEDAESTYKGINRSLDNHSSG